MNKILIALVLAVVMSADALADERITELKRLQKENPALFNKKVASYKVKSDKSERAECMKLVETQARPHSTFSKEIYGFASKFLGYREISVYILDGKVYHFDSESGSCLLVAQ